MQDDELSQGSRIGKYRKKLVNGKFLFEENWAMEFTIGYRFEPC